jgi:hypothetical protein
LLLCSGKCIGWSSEILIWDHNEVYWQSDLCRMVGAGSSCELSGKCDVHSGPLRSLWLRRNLPLHWGDYSWGNGDPSLLSRWSKVRSKVWERLAWVLSSGALENDPRCLLGKYT